MKIRFVYGRKKHKLHLIPTIGVEVKPEYSFVGCEFLCWYVGFEKEVLMQMTIDECETREQEFMRLIEEIAISLMFDESDKSLLILALRRSIAIERLNIKDMGGKARI